MEKFVRNRWNTRIPCICQIRTANILWEGHPVATISEEANDAGETDWVIRVDWEAFKQYNAPPISGIDMDLKLDEYVRTGMIPSFVDERTLPDNRDGLMEELEAVGLTYNDRFEFMCRTHGICGPSRFTVERKQEN